MYKLIVLGVFLLSFAACSEKKKTVDQTYPKLDTNICPNQSQNQFIVQWESGKVSIEKAKDREALIENLVRPRLEEIKHVENDIVISLDTRTADRSASSEVQNWHHLAINSLDAWSNNITGKGSIVAVIDSGVDLEHIDLEDAIAINEAEIPGNGIDDDNNGFVDDYKGWDFYDNDSVVSDPASHGTHVAGIISAKHWIDVESNEDLTSSRDVFGVAPEAKILPIRFLGPRGDGNLSAAIAAVEYAAQQGADIINASWGGTQCSQILNNKIIELKARGIVFVTASGNESYNVDSIPVYPGAVNSANLINVAATTSNGPLASFSNKGVSTVHVGAPGVNILSTVPGDRLSVMSGTSMAAPIVSGLAALIKSKLPLATPEEIISIIKNSVVTSSRLEVETRGRIDISNTVNSIR